MKGDGRQAYWSGRALNRRIREPFRAVGQHVAEPEFLHTLGVGTNRAGVGTNLGVREHHPDLQCHQSAPKLRAQQKV